MDAVEIALVTGRSDEKCKESRTFGADVDAVETSLAGGRSDENGSETKIADMSGWMGEEAVLGWRGVDLFALFTLPGVSDLRIVGTATEVSGTLSNVADFSFTISSSC
jgi:hypothetical protein